MRANPTPAVAGVKGSVTVGKTGAAAVGSSSTAGGGAKAVVGGKAAETGTADVNDIGGFHVEDLDRRIFSESDSLLRDTGMFLAEAEKILRLSRQAPQKLDLLHVTSKLNKWRARRKGNKLFLTFDALQTRLATVEKELTAYTDESLQTNQALLLQALHLKSRLVACVEWNAAETAVGQQVLADLGQLLSGLRETEDSIFAMLVFFDEVSGMKARENSGYIPWALRMANEQAEKEKEAKSGPQLKREALERRWKKIKKIREYVQTSLERKARMHGQQERNLSNCRRALQRMDAVMLKISKKTISVSNTSELDLASLVSSGSASGSVSRSNPIHDHNRNLSRLRVQQQTVAHSNNNNDDNNNNNNNNNSSSSSSSSSNAVVERDQGAADTNANNLTKLGDMEGESEGFGVGLGLDLDDGDDDVGRGKDNGTSEAKESEAATSGGSVGSSGSSGGDGSMSKMLSSKLFRASAAGNSETIDNNTAPTSNSSSSSGSADRREVPSLSKQSSVSMVPVERYDHAHCADCDCVFHMATECTLRLAASQLLAVETSTKFARLIEARDQLRAAAAALENENWGDGK